MMIFLSGKVSVTQDTGIIAGGNQKGTRGGGDAEGGGESATDKLHNLSRCQAYLKETRPSQSMRKHQAII